MNAKIKGLAVLGLAVVLGLGACSSSDRTSNGDSGSVSGEKGVPPAAQPGGGNDSLGGGDPQANPNPAAPVGPATRSIVYTGDMTVRAQDVNATANRITQMVTTSGGFIGSDQRSSSTASSTTATMVLRIPAAAFGDTVDALGKLPDVSELSRSFSQQDVTGQVVDLDARIGAAQVSIARLKELMANAASTADLLTISNELSRLEGDLASLQAQRDKLKDLVSLSTLTVTVLGPTAPLPPNKDDTGFLVGLKNGWHAFTKSLDVLVTVIGALLPFVLALGIPAFGLFWWSRRRRAARSAVVAQPSVPVHPAYGNAPAPVGARAGNPPAAQVHEPTPPSE